MAPLGQRIAGVGSGSNPEGRIWLRNGSRSPVRNCGCSVKPLLVNRSVAWAELLLDCSYREANLGFSPTFMWSNQRFFAMVIALALLAIDYLVGSQISVAVLYYLPIAYAAWYLGWGSGFGMSLLCVGTLTWAKLETGAHYSSGWILAERSLVRLIAFGFVAFSLNYCRRTKDRNESKIHQLERLITFCSRCRKIQDMQGNWVNLEHFSHDPSDLTLAKLCPVCVKAEYSANARRSA